MAKKVELIIVEGPSDEDALGIIFGRLYNPDVVHVEVVHGDMTSVYGTRPDNIAKKVEAIVKSVARKRKLKMGDFRKVIHLVDTDGAYIPDDAIVEVMGLRSLQYTTDTIYANNKRAICDRNAMKRKNLDTLAELTVVCGSVPYSVYYMSSNLDHVLHNKLNSSNLEKENDAFKFARKYGSNLEAFKIFMCRSQFAVPGDYVDTWEFIKQDRRSLERFSNLRCLIEEDEL